MVDPKKRKYPQSTNPKPPKPSKKQKTVVPVESSSDYSDEESSKKPVGRPPGKKTKNETIQAITVIYSISDEEINIHPLKHLNGTIDTCPLTNIIELKNGLLAKEEVFLKFF